MAADSCGVMGRLWVILACVHVSCGPRDRCSVNPPQPWVVGGRPECVGRRAANTTTLRKCCKVEKAQVGRRGKGTFFASTIRTYRRLKTAFHGTAV